MRTNITQRPGCQRIGIAKTSSNKASKDKVITRIVVSDLQELYQVSLNVETNGRVFGYLELSSVGAMELVKAILQNLHAVTLCADEEFRKIVKDKIDAADEDARQVVSCLNRSMDVSPIPVVRDGELTALPKTGEES